VIFDDALPIVFPFNFPDEAFWFTADAAIAEAQVDLTYGAALEAAFAGGVPVPGDQVSFARVRIRADITLDLQTPGTYVVTHPYGVETFTQVAPGRRVINMTRDIGIGGAGDFTGALAGDIGPFLHGVGGPYIETNPETGEAETYIGDPNLLEQVTGSPFGTNFVRIQRTDNPGLGIDYTTDLFAVSGRIWNGQRPTNVNVDRSTYSRAFDATTGVLTTNIDVFANTPDSTTASVCFREDIDLVPGTPPSPCLIDMTGDGAGGFFGQDPAPLTLPPFVVVTATDPAAAVPTTPTPLASALTDVVTVSRALYAKDTQTLIVDAASSDEVIPPTLAALGFGRFSFVPGTVSSQRLQVSGLAEPPALVTVFSSAGGRDVEPVVVVDTAPANNAPVANPDAATTAEDTAVTIDVLGNDTDADGDALAVTGVTGVSNGSASVNADGSVTLTPAPNFFGTATFSYNISDGNGGIASAGVTVTVTPVNDPPQITSQPVTGATIGQPYTYDVNAVDPEGDALTYSLTQAPAGMTIDAATGVISWTPAGNQAGANPVTVQVTDNGTTDGAADPRSATQSFTVTVGAGVDYDISRFSVSGNVRTGRTGTISLRFTNAGTVQQLRTATVTGTQNGGSFYNQSLQISAAPGRTVTVSFPGFSPAVTGNITWRVEIFDDNPDTDVANAATTVNR
jgi:hypothetical protein